MSSRLRAAAGFASWLGLVGHLCVLYLYLATGLLAPFWAIILLFFVWLGLLAAAVWAVRARSAWGLLVPVLALFIWWGTLTAGETFLGWHG